MANEERELIQPQGTGRGPGPGHERDKTLRVITGGSIAEAFAGAAAVVLAIIALAGTLPVILAAIATIAVGVALLAQGSSVAAKWSHVAREFRAQRPDERLELVGGLGAEVLGGTAGIVLGVLAILGLAPLVLLPIALLAFGGSLLLGSGVTIELGSGVGPGAYDRYAHLVREASMGASGAQALAGVGAVVLGILALIGTLPETLTLVGLLAVGTAVLFSGSAVSSRLVSRLRR